MKGDSRSPLSIPSEPSRAQPKTNDALVCEIISPAPAPAAALAEIAVTCADDVGLPLAVRTLHVGRPVASEPTLTLHLPLSLASSQHQVWCLACRLACFCPDARVSVLVLGDAAFRSGSVRTADGNDSLHDLRRTA